MEKTANRFVAFIDIMGFKDLVSKTEHEDILKKLEYLNRYIEAIKTRNLPSNYKDSELLPYIFSDSIIIFTNNDSKDTAVLLLWACELIFSGALTSKIPIKGAISHGKMTVDPTKSIFFGQPLIDAYLLQDEVKYYGMVLHNTAESKNV